MPGEQAANSGGIVTLMVYAPANPANGINRKGKTNRPKGIKGREQGKLFAIRTELPRQPPAAMARSRVRPLLPVPHHPLARVDTPRPAVQNPVIP